MRRWYVAYTQANAELKALRHLTNQGFKAYLPRYLKNRRHARKVDTVETPMFPRYLFVHLDVEIDRWRAILSTVGISNLICRGVDPCSIHDEIIDTIRSREDTAGHIVLGQGDGLNKGDNIRIVDGPLTDHEGIFDSASSSNRVHVLLNLMGRSIQTEVPRNFVIAG
jgi:transcriptional antiterminator RfaH